MRQVNRYLNKVSGPLLDRIDLHIEVGAVEFDTMISNEKEENSSVIRDRVIQASTNLLANTMKHHNLSARAYDRILKVSRTIADLAGSEQISFDHFAEEVRYRYLDKEGWGKTSKSNKLNGEVI